MSISVTWSSWRCISSITVVERIDVAVSLQSGQVLVAANDLDQSLLFTVSNTSPMLSLGFQINDQWNSYLRYARGYKSGGFSCEDFYIAESRNEFEPEDAVLQPIIGYLSR